MNIFVRYMSTLIPGFLFSLPSSMTKEVKKREPGIIAGADPGFLEGLHH